MLKLPSKRDVFASMPAFYEEELRPFLQVNESVRKQSVIRGGIIFAVVFFLAYAVLWIFQGGAFPLMYVFGAGIIGAGVAGWYIDRTRNQITEGLLGKICIKLGFSYVRNIQKPDYFQHFKELKFFSSFNMDSWEDEVRGSHAGRDFVICEANLVRRGHGENSSDTTIFHGQLLVIDYPKKFTGQTVLRRDKGLLNRLGKPGSQFSRVGLASAKFEKIYEAWSTDQVEGRELLDPVVLERFEALEELFGGAKLQAAFSRGKLLVSLETGDKLTMGSMFSALEDQSRVETILSEFDLIFDLMDLAVKPIGGKLKSAVSVEAIREN